MILRKGGYGYLEKQEWEPIEWQTRHNLSDWTIEVIGHRMKQDRIISNESQNTNNKQKYAYIGGHFSNISKSDQ